MEVYSAARVAEALPYEVLVEALHSAFKARSAVVPQRSVHSIGLPSGSTALFVTMPAWEAGKAIAVKLASIFPPNAGRGLPVVHAQIVVFNGATGEPMAVVDGTEVTRRRTAAASALAAKFLAREDAKRLLVVGTGEQAPHNALAHSAVRPIRHIDVWGRSPEKASATIKRLRQKLPTTRIDLAEELEGAVRSADVISCATSSPEPLLHGEWLSPGVFVDLVGAFSPTTREVDDEAVRRARVYADTLAGVMAEAGDVIIPIEHGVIRESDVVGDLYGLCRGEVSGRSTANEITLFKSVGTAVEDLAAAQLVVARACVR